MIMFYQKNFKKLKFRWKNFFLIDFSKNHDISWRLKQLNEKFIKKIYHENHFKSFIFRTEYFSKNESYSETSNLKKSKKIIIMKTWFISIWKLKNVFLMIIIMI